MPGPELKQERGPNIDLATILPHLGAIILFYALIADVFYYQQFGLNILLYIEISEIITPFYNYLLIALIVFFLIFGFQYLINGKILKENVAETERPNRIAITCFIIAAIGICVFVWKLFDIKMLIWTAILLASMAVTFWIIRHLNLRSALILSYLLIYTTLLFVIKYYEYYQVYINHKNYGITIILKNGSQIFSDEKCYYIGKSKDYYFLYNVSTKCVSASKMENVESITYPNL